MAMLGAVARTNAASLADSSALNGPIPGSSFKVACIQFSAVDPALPGTAMGEATWARCLVPPELGSAPLERNRHGGHGDQGGHGVPVIQARELGRGPRGPTPLYLEPTAVPHGAVAK